MLAGGRGPMKPDQLIERIYDLADTPHGWREVLAHASTGFSADKAHLFLVGPEGRVEQSEFHGYDPSLISSYHAHFQKDDPRILLGLANPGRVLCDADGPNEFENSPVYHELLKQVDVRYTLHVQIPVEKDLLLAQAFMRPHSSAPFQREQVDGFQRLLPHICRAVKLGRLLAGMRSELRDLRLALNLVPIPIAILDATGKVVCLSQRAEQLLDGDASLVLEHQRLTAALPRHRQAIGAALAATVRLSEPSTRASAAPVTLPAVVEVMRASGRPINLSFMPLRPTHGIRQKADPGARVLVVFHDAADTVRMNPELLSQLHALTPTEAKLAAALAEGESLAQFASSRGCSEQTARTHLKRIFDKTGTHRQAELVRLLMSSAALHLAAA